MVIMMMMFLLCVGCRILMNYSLNCIIRSRVSIDVFSFRFIIVYVFYFFVFLVCFCCCCVC